MNLHLRYVRCEKCLRVFCCFNHRVEHERRTHVEDPVPVPVIKRRFRSDAIGMPLRSIDNFVAVAARANCRKRLHATAIDKMKSRTGCGMLSPAVPQRLQTPARNILKAHRSCLSSSTINRLRPVAESSPTVPPTPGPLLPPPPPPPPPPPQHEVGTPAGSDISSPPSFYHTPMQTPSGMVLSPESTCTNITSAAALTDTPTSAAASTDTPISKGAKRVSLGHDSTQKGFFWTKMARRFRLALRPAKPKINESNVSPSAVDLATKYYGNIRPRQPINKDASMTTVDARPSLEDIRKAHEEANKVSSDHEQNE